MISPCIKNCKLKYNKCIGCKRTIQQIKNWYIYSELERIQIMEKIKNPNTHGNNMNTNYSVNFRLLDDIRFCAENALELAKLSKEEYTGKINWNEIEIKNNGVEFFVNLNGCDGYRIEISNCAEKCTNLYNFIEDYIMAELKVPVEVLSEY